MCVQATGALLVVTRGRRNTRERLWSSVSPVECVDGAAQGRHTLDNRNGKNALRPKCDRVISVIIVVLTVETDRFRYVI